MDKKQQIKLSISMGSPDEAQKRKEKWVKAAVKGGFARGLNPGLSEMIRTVVDKYAK